MRNRRDAGQEVYRKGGFQDRWDAGLEGCGKADVQERRDEGKVGCRKRKDEGCKFGSERAQSNSVFSFDVVVSYRLLNFLFRKIRNIRNRLKSP